MTTPALRAHKLPETGRDMGTKAGRAIMMGVTLLGPALLAGCIKLEAPSEPIVIELNINITQEVIYRLAEDAGNTLDENADIF
ncbi:YnbE family lipoprotein [Aurantiacibacter flavus]|uniref:YnbE family lipoprotein n=1 Tax=Aurantiacibacter flavus TaxID=3145232 RepID=A0ABV0CWC3_9SPHN